MLKAAASARSAWQFCDPGELLTQLLRETQATFREAIDLLGLPAEFFGVPYEGAQLPAMLLRASDPSAPTLLVVGGADSALENIFFTIGRGAWERGLNVANVDLPGSNATALDGLHWTGESERPIGAAIDCLLERGVDPAKLALVGFSLGGFWAGRAAGREPRRAACVASTPFPEPRELFGSAAVAAAAERGASRSKHGRAAVERRRRERARTGGTDGHLGRRSGRRALPVPVDRRHCRPAGADAPGGALARGPQGAPQGLYRVRRGQRRGRTLPDQLPHTHDAGGLRLGCRGAGRAYASLDRSSSWRRANFQRGASPRSPG